MFDHTKELLTSAPLLVHYNDNFELLLTADTSIYGLGAVLSHRMHDGTEQPIAYAFKLLSKSERRYSQLDKEALSIISAVTKFLQFLIGRHFVILSDHKPLHYLLVSDKAVLAMASARIQHWALLSSAYHYSIAHRPGKDHANTETFSRLPLPTTPAEQPDTRDTILLFECLQVSPLNVTDIRRGTDRDPLLSKVCKGGLHIYWERSSSHLCAVETSCL